MNDAWCFQVCKCRENSAPVADPRKILLTYLAIQESLSTSTSKFKRNRFYIIVHDGRVDPCYKLLD
jgi:hypothetical protein